MMIPSPVGSTPFSVKDILNLESHQMSCSTHNGESRPIASVNSYPGVYSSSLPSCSPKELREVGSTMNALEMQFAGRSDEIASSTRSKMEGSNSEKLSPESKNVAPVSVSVSPHDLYVARNANRDVEEKFNKGPRSDCSDYHSTAHDAASALVHFSQTLQQNQQLSPGTSQYEAHRFPHDYYAQVHPYTHAGYELQSYEGSAAQTSLNVRETGQFSQECFSKSEIDSGLIKSERHTSPIPAETSSGTFFHSPETVYPSSTSHADAFSYNVAPNGVPYHRAGLSGESTTPHSDVAPSTRYEQITTDKLSVYGDHRSSEADLATPPYSASRSHGSDRDLAEYRNPSPSSQSPVAADIHQESNIESFADQASEESCPRSYSNSEPRHEETVTLAIGKVFELMCTIKN